MISQTSGLLSQVLDVNTLVDNMEDSKIALLRKVEFKRTVDDVPFLRMIFSDINGQNVVGRIFNLENFDKIGMATQALIGHLVMLSFTCESRDQGLRCTKIQRINEQTESTLKDMIADSRTSRFQSVWDEFVQVLVSLKVFDSPADAGEFSVFRGFSHATISNGQTGAICNVIKLTCMSAIAAGVPASTLKTFVSVVKVWCDNQVDGETRVDLAKISFVSSAVTLLPNEGTQAEIMKKYQIVSEFVSLFLGVAELRNAYTELVWNLFKTYSKLCTLNALAAAVPAGGIYKYDGVTYRK